MDFRIYCPRCYTTYGVEEVLIDMRLVDDDGNDDGAYILECCRCGEQIELDEHLNRTELKELHCMRDKVWELCGRIKNEKGTAGSMETIGLW